MSLKLFRNGLFWPLTCVALICVSILASALFTVAQQADAAAKQREQAQVANGVQDKIEDLGAVVAPNANWDEAVRHLDNVYDPAWAQDNIAKFLSETYGFDAEFVLDGADQPIFAAHRAQPTSPQAYETFRGETASIVRAVRAMERRRGAFVRRPTGELLSKPIQASALALVGGEALVVTATLVQPDFGTALPKGATAPVVITARRIDAAFRDDLAERFLLEDAHLHLGDTPAETRKARAYLRDQRGAVIGAIDWRPQNPGATVLRTILTPLTATLGLLGVVALALYGRGRRVARELIESEARAAHLAYFDSLTGLPNRVTFFDRLSQGLEASRRSGVAIAVHAIDLDRFKEVNDTFGHQTGDELIQAAGRLMAAQCRSGDTFARLSGDEFAVIQFNATPQGAATLAARLIEAFRQPVDLAAGRVFVGCSIGVLVIAEPGIEPVEALRQADLALYRAKENGGGQFCFFELEMDAAIKMRRLLEADLRTALAEDQLHMVYQPQIDRRGVVNGVEALVRWRHPERGQLAPAYFVPIAEECGLIRELGMFTLRRAFEDSRRWSRLKVAVNVSANQLRLPDFAAEVQALVDELEVDPRRFELEITEGVLLGDDPGVHGTLNHLRSMGFSLALDDFGTGYSSLSYLQRFPVTKIKIDRAFIANLGVDAEAAAVVSAIVKLARALKLEVIAEGVETEQQRSQLLAAGCHDLQGYLVSRPIPADQITPFCNGQKPDLQQAG